MQRARTFRPHVSKVFIPMTEDFRNRQSQRRSAVLADIIGRSNLGHFPQERIAVDLAERFGGFSTDFLVARYQERDFVILLPEWVRPEDLINNGLTRLAHCRLRCFSWEPYQNADISSLSYKAWVKIGNLPFECWSTPRVSGIVSGFGRFLRVDDNSVNIVDMSGFRCLVAVDDLTDIREHLAISLGDVVITVPVRIESTAPFGGEDRGTPFAGGEPQRREGSNRSPGYAVGQKNLLCRVGWRCERLSRRQQRRTE